METLIPFVQHESIEIILVCDQNGIYVCLPLAIVFDVYTHQPSYWHKC